LTSPSAISILDLNQFAWTLRAGQGSSTGSANMINFLDTAGNTGTGTLVNIQTFSGTSGMQPLHVQGALSKWDFLKTGNIQFSATTPATSSSNTNSPLDGICGLFWTGAASLPHCFNWQITMGAGATGAAPSTLSLNASGSSGPTAVDLSNLSNVKLPAGSTVGGVVIGTASTFNGLAGGTNTSAAMLIGSGASFGPTGTGIVTANGFIGNIPILNLAGGTGATNSTFLRGDNTWATPPIGASYGTTPVLNCIPAVSSVSGSGQFVNSSLCDDGTQVTGNEPFNLTNNINMQPTSTATSSSGNFGSFTLAGCTSYWSTTLAAPVTDCTTQFNFISSGSTPSLTENHVGPATMQTYAVGFETNSAFAATSSQNYNSPRVFVRGRAWNGAASQLFDCNWQALPAAGANPNITVNHNCVGTTGQVVDQFAGVVVTGTPMIESQVSTNTDISGELAFSSDTSKTYTFQNTYLVHPECWKDAQFDPGSGVRLWITYTSTTMTINASSAVTGNISYGCTGRS
jgi:hypothetical protein